MPNQDIHKFPLPDIIDGEPVWSPLVSISRQVPWGYERHSEDPDILIPITEELILLEQAKEHLKKYSYRDVAAWLSEESGRSISHVGLCKRVKNEYKRQKEFNQSVHLARRYREAYEKARRLYEIRLDRKKSFEEESGLETTPEELLKEARES